MSGSEIHLPAFYDALTEAEISAEGSTHLDRLPDPDGETTLPFTPMGGPRFEILTYHLLSGGSLIPRSKVILVKSTGDQGRDVLVYVDGKLQTIVQCKNLSAPLDKPRLLREIVKLALHDIKTPFLPEGVVKYELWAPGGLSQPAEQLLAAWQTQPMEEDVQAAFEAITSEYAKLKEINWDESRERLLTTLRTKIEPWRQLNLDVARRVRNNHDLYIRHFAVTSVMPTNQVEAYFRQRSAREESTRSELLSLTTRTNETLNTIQENLTNTPYREATSDVDRDIDQARDKIRAGAPGEGRTLLNGVQERYGGRLTPHHRFRVVSNLAYAALHESKLLEASRFFLQALQYEPENEDARINEVLAYYLLPDNERAFRLASGLRKKYPATPRLACLWVATAPSEMKTSDLKKELGPILASEPEVLGSLAQRALQRDEFEAALDYASSAKKLRGEWSVPIQVLAQVELRQALPSDILRVVKKQDRLEHGDKAVTIATEALSLARRENAKPSQVEILLVRCRGYLVQGKIAEGSDDAAAAAALLPNHADALLALTESKFAEGKLEEAADAAERLNAISPMPHIRIMQAQALAGTETDANLDKAVAILKEVTSQLPAAIRPHAVVLAMKVMVRRGKLDVAQSYLGTLSGQLDPVTELAARSAIEPDANRAVEIALEAKSRCTEETNPETKDFLGRTFMRLQRPGDAMSLFQELYSAEFPGLEVRFLVDCAFKLERHDIIMEVFDKLSEQPGRQWGEIEFEVQFLEKYDIPKAVVRLTAFLNENPNHKVAQLRLSTIGVLHRRPELVKPSLADLPAVEELPGGYIRVAIGVVSQGPDRANAVDYAYRYLRLHFDELDAHRAMIQSVLATGSLAIPEVSLPVVVMGAAVQYQLQPTGELRWVVLEATTPSVRDFDEITPSDPRTAELVGKKVGDTFVAIKGSIRSTEAVIKHVMPKYLRRHHDCLARLPELFPDSNVVESIPIEPADHPLQLGLAAVLASAQTRFLRAEQVRMVYQTMPMSLHLYGAPFGKNAYAALMNIAVTEKLHVKCALGTSEEYQRASATLANAFTIVLDLSAIATLRLLGLSKILKSRTYKFAISDDTALELDEILGREISESSDGGILAFEDGEYRMYQESAEDRKRRREGDREFLRELHEDVSTVSPTRMASWTSEERTSISDYVGLYGAEAISIAKEDKTVLWTDDVIQSQLGFGMFGTVGVWTQCVLARLAAIGELSREEFVIATAKLVGFEYAGTYIDSAVFVEAARQAQYDPEATPLRQAIENLASPQANPQVRFGMFRQLLNHLYSTDVSPLRNCMVTRACLAALAQTPVLWQQLMILRLDSQILFGLNVIAEQQFNRCFDAWTQGY